MNIADIKAAIPWWAKIAIKLPLARLPTDYRLWQKINLFKHGFMEQPAYAYRTFRTHFDRSEFSGKAGGFTCLEVGPGDTLFSALIAHALGSRETHLIDSGKYARYDLQPYRAMHSYLSGLGLADQEPNVARLEDWLELCNAQHDCDGLTSVLKVPDASVDWIWSNAVLEHIRKAEFLPYMQALRRVLKPVGICSHRVDLRDHLDGALNNLRFSDRIWESEWMATSGFYTNRIGFSEMCDLFRDAGFDVRLIAIDRWSSLPTPRAKMYPRFRVRSDADLCVKGFDVLLSPRD